MARRISNFIVTVIGCLSRQTSNSDRIAIEFSFHYFLKLRALAFQFDIRIARDWMIIDREKNITGLDNTSADGPAVTTVLTSTPRSSSFNPRNLLCAGFCSFE